MSQSYAATILDKLDSEFIFVLMLIGGIVTAVTIMVVVTNAMKCWRGYRESKLGSDMIREMLDRQMTADNIVAVMSSWKGGPAGAELAQQMLDRQAGIPPKPLKSHVQMGT